jgi:hypothetical protein
VQLQGVDDFKPIGQRDNKSPSANRTVVSYLIDGEVGSTIKIVGYWYSRQHLAAQNSAIASIGPQISQQKPDGTFVNGILLAPPDGSPTEDCILVLTCEVTDQVLNDGKPYLLIFGGFDDKVIAIDKSNDTSASFLLYAQREEDFDVLTKQLGSVDFHQEQKQDLV